MGRKSVPYIDESSLLRMRLRDALEDEQCRVSFVDEDDDGDDDEDVMASPAGSATLPGGLTLEDLYRRNRNRARLIGLLHSHRSCHGASIVVLMSDADGRDGRHDRDAMGWLVQPHDAEQMPELVH